MTHNLWMIGNGKGCISRPLRLAGDKTVPVYGIEVLDLSDFKIGSYCFFSTAAPFSPVRMASSRWRKASALAGGISTWRTTYSLS